MNYNTNSNLPFHRMRITATATDTAATVHFCVHTPGGAVDSSAAASV